MYYMDLSIMYYFWTVFGVIKPTAVPDVKDHGCALMLLGPNLGNLSR